MRLKAEVAIPRLKHRIGPGIVIVVVLGKPGTADHQSLCVDVTRLPICFTRGFIESLGRAYGCDIQISSIS